MGIPSFYRWLVEKSPRTVVDVAEETPATVNGIDIPIDSSKPNPNGIEFDNLYIDMNGIIHPCFHPEGLPAPETYDEVFKGVFKYIDRLFSMIRPRKLLYMAIDGVAPRAKMNQQRARRFRAAKEAADKASEAETLGGADVTGGEEKGARLDSNVITPGTTFLELLSSALQYYVHLKMNSDPGWRGIKVILSDASVPGEGEHKIMSYIRLQRNLEGFDPNTRHCLYGLDADLVMLALASHEAQFFVLREDIRRGAQKDRCSEQGNHSSHLNNLQEGKSSKGEEYMMYLEDFILRQRFQFLSIWVLRENLLHEFSIPNPVVKLDIERLIDDFVFMCLFVGNDFLPHVPSLEISEGAIDLLMGVYNKEFNLMGGYLTNSSNVDLARVEHFVQAVGTCEAAIFAKRNQAQKDWEIRLRRSSAAFTTAKGIDPSTNPVDSKALISVDKVKLGETGWKDRYYFEKFEVQNSDEYEKLKRDAVFKYVEGICWAMHYYYQGVCSWNWFYPYHYAPFASDFEGLTQLDIKFLLGKPFKPFDQLMGVLPASSAEALPLFYRELMTDPSSPILDFYPSDFELDLNGKRRAWQGVCKLPFIEEARLLSEIEKVEHTLTDDEKQRNSLSLDVLFVCKPHPLATKILSSWEHNHPKSPKVKLKRKIDPELSDGMNGYIYISSKPVCPVEISSPIDEMDLTTNEVISVFYEPPSFHSHISKLPKGVTFPGKQSVLPGLEDKQAAIGTTRISERRLPPQCVLGPCLAKLAHQLVSLYCRASDADGCRKDDSEVGKRKLNCQVDKKCSYAVVESEDNFKGRKGGENCQLEQKDSNAAVGSEENSKVRKREQDFPNDKIGKKSKNKRRRAKNVDRGSENSSEVRTREYCQVDQKDGNADGGSEHNQLRRQNCQLEQRDRISEKDSEGRKRKRGMADDKIANGKICEKKNVERGSGNNPEVSAREQNCQVDQKESNAGGESEIKSELSKREQNYQMMQKDGNVDRVGGKISKGKRRDIPDGEIGNFKIEMNVKRGSENNLEIAPPRELNYQVNHKESNADGESENNAELSKREKNYQAAQNENQEREQDKPDVKIANDKIAKKKRNRKKENVARGNENNPEVEARELNCQVNQQHSNAVGESENNSELTKRKQNCQVPQKGSNVDGVSGKDSEGKTRKRDMPDDETTKMKKKNRNQRRRLNKALHKHQKTTDALSQQSVS